MLFIVACRHLLFCCIDASLFLHLLALPSLHTSFNIWNEHFSICSSTSHPTISYRLILITVHDCSSLPTTLFHTPFVYAITQNFIPHNYESLLQETFSWSISFNILFIAKFEIATARSIILSISATHCDSGYKLTLAIVETFHSSIYVQYFLVQVTMKRILHALLILAALNR